MYEICDSDDDRPRTLKRATLPDYKAGIALYYAGDFSGADAVFARVLDRNPGDIPARHFLEKSRNLLASGMPPGWDGISRYDSKH